MFLSHISLLIYKYKLTGFIIVVFLIGLFHKFVLVKKFLVIFFSIFYLTSTSGISLNIHYCGGKIKHITLFNSSEKCCCGKKKMSKKCCKDKVSYFKIKDDQQSNQSAKIITPTSKITPVVLPVFKFDDYIVCTNVTVFNYHAPPVLYDNPLYLKYQVLLI